MKRMLMAVLIMLAMAMQAQAEEEIERAMRACRSAVDRFYAGSGGAVTWPVEAYTRSANMVYFVQFKDDLKATLAPAMGMPLALDVRCSIQRETFKPLMITVNRVSLPVD
mgnify:CR=1 FL=1